MSLCWIGDNDPSHKMILNNKEITSFNEEKRLGILSYSKLIFDSHITPLCNKAGQTLSTQLSYCAPIWMFTTRHLNNDTFPHSQFLIEGFITPCRLDHDSNGGGICQGRYSFQLNCNRKQTNRNFVCRAKLA